MAKPIYALLALVAGLHAREIAFPPVSGFQRPLGLNADIMDVPGDSNPLDLSQAQWAGLSTYAHLPYVHCLANGSYSSSGQAIEKYDIAILGAPFDTGVTARPGARFGPHGIRQGSTRIAPQFAYNIYTGKNAFLQGLKVVDCGDAPLTFLDNTIALKQLDKAHRMISARPALHSEYSVPRIITLGGDHTTTLSALRSTFDHWGAVSVIHFDSHLDTWDPNVLGGGLSHYAGVNHGTFLHIAHEEGLLLNSSIHAGIRAPTSNKKYDLRNDKACGFDIVRARDIDKLGMQGVIDVLKARTNGTSVYISVDIDVLDPAFAPATGTAEVGGWTTRELLTILDGLSGMHIIGADVGKLCPLILILTSRRWKG
jgi:agmatinase